MPEYITKEAVKQAMRSQPRGILFTEWELDRVPTVDAVEVVHGYWTEYGIGHGRSFCSECGYNGKRSMNYCPECGAKMDGGV